MRSCRNAVKLRTINMRECLQRSLYYAVATAAATYVIIIAPYTSPCLAHTLCKAQSKLLACKAVYSLTKICNFLAAPSATPLAVISFIAPMVD